MTRLLRTVLGSLALGVLLMLIACVGATPMIKRERGPNGDELPKNSLDLSFVQPGITTRDEVLAKLSTIDSGYSDPLLFWGRWASSNWGYGWMVVAPSPNGGGAAGAGDGKRVWHVHNVLITFDENGMVKNKDVLNDDQPLWRELHKYVGTLPPADSSEVVSFAYGKSGAEQIAFSADGITAGHSRGKIRSVRFAPNKIVRFSHSGPLDKRESPGTTCHVLQLSENTAFGKKIRFCADPRNMIAIFRYLQRFGSPSMQWE